MPKSPPRYPDAFRQEAVALVQSGERSIPQIARDLGINEQTLRTWVKRAELVRLRRETASCSRRRRS